MDFFSQLNQNQTQTQKIQNQTQIQKIGNQTQYTHKYKHTQKIQNQTRHTHNTNTTCFKIQEHKPMNLLSFNKTNPNPTQKHKLRNTKEQAQEHKPI